MVVDHILSTQAFVNWSQNDRETYDAGRAGPPNWEQWGRNALRSYARQHADRAAILEEDFLEGIKQARKLFNELEA